MSLMRLLVVVVVYERLQWGILSVYMFLESNCIWFVMRNLLLILLMVSWEIIKVGDYEYFVHDDLSVQFFWFNLIEKKNREKQWVLAQMLPHLHQKNKTQICIGCVYWGEVYVLLNVLIENIISLRCTVYIRWPCRKLASLPFDSCFLLYCGGYWLQVCIVNHVDAGC